MTIYAGVISNSDEANLGFEGMCGAIFYQDSDPTDKKNKCLKITTKNTVLRLDSTTNIAAEQLVDLPSAYEFEMRHYFDRLTWLFAPKYFTIEFRNKANVCLFSAKFQAANFVYNKDVSSCADHLEMVVNGKVVEGVKLYADKWNRLKLEYYPGRESHQNTRLKVYISDDSDTLDLIADIPVDAEPGVISRAAIVHSATKIKGIQYLDDISFSATDAKYTDSREPSYAQADKRHIHTFESGIPSSSKFNIEMQLKKMDDRIPYDPARLTADLKNSPYGHSHNFHEIMLVLTGIGTFFANEEKYAIKPGNIIVVPPGVHHGIVSTQGYNIISIAGHFERLAFASGACVLEDNIYGEGKKLAELILYNRFGSEDYLQTLCDSYIKYILLSLESPVKNTTASIYKIISKMEKNFGNSDISIGKLLDDSGYTKDYIRTEFLAITKMTPKKYLTEIRMKNAKAMLDLYGDEISIGEIAERCGILDQSIFSRIFKKHFGISPTQYREKKTKQ